MDVSQFYPSLYTHAVGWAIDPKLRQRKHWKNFKLLGKQLDQFLMDAQGKVSQGIPIGPDLSFLLAECVLGQVDRLSALPVPRSFRWFDDYEIACYSRPEAEAVLRRLTTALDRFNLRPNPLKTRIAALPLPAGEGWQSELLGIARRGFSSVGAVIDHFDHAFRLRELHPDSPILMYAIGVLFQVKRPSVEVLAACQSCITQCLLAEPGCAQKAFSLLLFWEINGTPFDRAILRTAINRLVELHSTRGGSSDLAWALAFGIQHLECPLI